MGITVHVELQVNFTLTAEHSHWKHCNLIVHNARKSCTIAYRVPIHIYLKRATWYQTSSSFVVVLIYILVVIWLSEIEML